uniref:Transmembrane protein n=1 Tax=Strongyloides venezuelensis TaxID=75913 RepID=A0A0K0FLT9_STRVS
MYSLNQVNEALNYYNFLKFFLLLCKFVLENCNFYVNIKQKSLVTFLQQYIYNNALIHFFCNFLYYFSQTFFW